MLISQFQFKKSEELEIISNIHASILEAIESEVIENLKSIIKENGINNLATENKSLKNIEFSSGEFSLEILQKRTETQIKKDDEKGIAFNEEVILGYELKISSISSFYFRATLEIIDEVGNINSSSRMFEGYLKQQKIDIDFKDTKITINSIGTTEIDVSFKPVS